MNLGVRPARTVLSEHAMHSTQSAGKRRHCTAVGRTPCRAPIPTLTSLQVGVGLVGRQEHGLTGLQPHHVEEVDGEAADVPGELSVQAQQQLPIACRCVLPFGRCERRGLVGGIQLRAWILPEDWGSSILRVGISPTLLGNPLHQQAELLPEDLLLALHQAGEAHTQGGRDAAGIVAGAALQLLSCHLTHQRPQLGDGCGRGQSATARPRGRAPRVPPAHPAGLTPQEGGDLLHGPEAAQPLEGSEGDGHLGFVVGVGVVLGELGVQLGCQLLGGDTGMSPRPGGGGVTMDTSRGALTLLGCAWMERAVRTDSTLKRKGRRPPKASRTLGPRQAGCSASQEPNDRGGSRPSNTSASPLGWAPIHSWGTALRPAQPRRDGGPRGRRDRASASPRRRAARARRSPRGPRWPPAVPRRCAARAAPRRSSSPGSATGTLQDGGGGGRASPPLPPPRASVPPGRPSPALTARLRHVRSRRVPRRAPPAGPVTARPAPSHGVVMSRSVDARGGHVAFRAGALAAPEAVGKRRKAAARSGAAAPGRHRPHVELRHQPVRRSGGREPLPGARRARSPLPSPLFLPAPLPSPPLAAGGTWR